MFVYLLLLVLFQPTLTSANLNLFLSQYEVKRLLGLENELYYVRDGTINKVINLFTNHLVLEN